VQKGVEEVLGDHTSALIITHRLYTVRRLRTTFFVLRDAEGLAPGESSLESSAGSFVELYEISSTFRLLADDSEPRLEISTEPVPEAEASIGYAEPESINLIARLIAH
jgi:hypothetical protein